MTPVSAPNLTEPLINEPAQANPPAPTTALGPLEQLVGTWTNQDIHGTGKGGQSSPYSYNLMVLPQVDPSSPTGYILKNFAYYEELTFSAIHGTAPNRGGMGTQVANTMFYEQRVYFADGPAKDMLVHAENGSWLYLSDTTQLLGPYGDGEGPNLGSETVANSTSPMQKFNIIKQISVPHGNSVLSAGTFQQKSGSPTISAPSPVLPVGVDTAQYCIQNVGNLNPAFTMNPNKPLMDAISAKNASSYIQFDVDSQNGGHGQVTNIGFEQQHAKVTRYYATYWLEAFGLVEPPDYTQLQYSQSILMDIPIAGVGTVSFPHITSNTLTKKN